MTGDSVPTTRIVTCPLCHADATLGYSTGADDCRRPRQVVYLCPNLCSLEPDEVTALLERAAALSDGGYTGH